MLKINRFFILTVMLFTALTLCAADKELRLGVYIYDYAFRRTAESDGVKITDFVDRHFKILQQNGVNTIHLTVSDPSGKQFREIWLPMLKKHGIKAYLQLDFAYFLPGRNWTEKYENIQAAKAGKFINTFKNTPEILAFSIREEVPHKDVNAMARYYQKIIGHAQDFAIFTLHNNLGAAKDQPVPDPVIYGTDRYAFWWEYSAGGYLASPDFSLNWTRNEAAKYYPEAAKRGADFSLVVTCNGYLTGASDLKKAWGSQNFVKRIEKYSTANNFGWQKSTIDNKDFYWAWKYYRLPQNCLRALIWTGILEGAKEVLFYSYTPVAQRDMSMTPEQLMFRSLANGQKLKGNAVWTTLAGRDGIENLELKEFAATAKELKPYSKLIPQMRKIEESVVETNNRRKIFNRSFSFHGLKGKAFVIHNANVGTWGANSRYFFNEDDDIKIDKEGHIASYKPLTAPMNVEFKLKNPADEVFDFRSGKKINIVNGKGTVEIIPGGGVILFAGTAQEFQKIFSAVK